ncbi:MAG: hypothetical protein ACJ763_15785 [Bdellovibrionia bacterium]
MRLKRLLDLKIQWRLQRYSRLGLILIIFQACASSDVQTQKSPSADLWTYHTYAWRAQGSTADQVDAADQAKERTDLDLAKHGMIPVPYEGNPDIWILQQTTPYGIAIELRDAHTGQTHWKGESHFQSSNGKPNPNMINAAVDALVDRYMSDRDWKKFSGWDNNDIKKG